MPSPRKELLKDFIFLFVFILSSKTQGFLLKWNFTLIQSLDLQPQLIFKQEKIDQQLTCVQEEDTAQSLTQLSSAWKQYSKGLEVA